MSNIGKRLATLSEEQLTEFAREFEQTRADLRRRTEAIAIVGIGCRFPGAADDPDAFWGLLRGAAEVSSDVPPDRAWSPVVPTRGYFLADPYRFDTALFGISPREARAMDPQHRLLLELAWQTFQSAGYAAPRMDGSQCGVFVGCYGDDHAHQLVWSRKVDDVDAHTSTGTSHSTGAGRVAYQFNLKGPAVCFDTACSSSLMAVHSACEALRSDDCDFALAGGVSLALSASTSLALDRARMLSPDGRSRAFDEAASGYGRGEGGGLVLLRRLSDARRDGDPILSVIMGSAVNHNGRASSLTSPSGEAQAAVIRKALDRAGLGIDDVDTVECFASGSPLGDTIEVDALRRVFGARPPERPLVIGSVKSNIGHLEAASGIASLIKVVLALQMGEIPPSLHVNKPAALIGDAGDWVSLATSPRPWPHEGKRRVAGLSAFGFGGTNLHLVVGHEAQSDATALVPPAGLRLPIWAATADKLRSHARDHARLVAAARASLPDLCRSLAVGPAEGKFRIVIPAVDKQLTLSALEAIGSSTDDAAFDTSGQDTSLLFLFVGQGAHLPGMGRVLYERIASFRAALRRCDAILADQIEVSLAELLWGSSRHLLAHARFAQPALFAFQHAFATMLAGMGIAPTGLIGHSLGELVAAQIAGVFDLETALRLVADRGKLLDSLPAGGAMAALATGTARASELAQAHGLDVAACNGPRQVVLSGSEAAIDHLLGTCGIPGARLDVTHAFHSRLVDPALEAWRRRLETCRFMRPAVPVYSNLTGRAETERLATPEYWVSHLRETVLFTQGMATAIAAGHRRVVEIGPSSTLAAAVRKLEGANLRVHPAPNSDDPLPGLADLLEACFVAGQPVDWSQLHGAMGGRRVFLPPAPLGGATLRHPAADSGERIFKATLEADHGTKLVGQRMPVPGTGSSLRRKIVDAAFEPIADHRLRGQPVLPAGYYLAAAAAVAGEEAGYGPWQMHSVHFAEPVVIQEEETRALSTVAMQLPHGLGIEFYSETDNGSAPVRHAGLVLTTGTPADAPAQPSLTGAADRIDDFYEQWREAGYDLGPSFRWLSEIRGAHGMASARLVRPLSMASAVHLHPGFYDCAFQLLAAAAASSDLDLSEGRMLVPAGIDAVLVHPIGGEDLFAAAAVHRRNGSGDSLVGDVEIRDGRGCLVAGFRGIVARALDLPAAGPFAAAPIAVQRDTTATARRKRNDLSPADCEQNRARALAAPPDRRVAQLADWLALELAAILEVPVDELDTSRSLNGLGVDSMLALEFKTLLERGFAVHLPVSEFLAGPSLTDVAAIMLARMADDVQPETPANDDLDVSLLDDSQVAALLNELMSKSQADAT